MQAIVNCDRSWGIGRNNDLMFSLSEDMAFFRRTTTGKVVVMGSNTLLSLPGGRPLKDRVNIVLWPDGDEEKAKEDGYILVRDLKDLFSAIVEYPPEDVFVIGGAMMYRTMLPYCSRVYVTKVDADGKADAFFEDLDRLDNWKMTYESDLQEDNGYMIRFTTYENSQPIEIRKGENE